MRKVSLVLGFEGVTAAKIESGYFLRPYLKELVQGVNKLCNGVYMISHQSNTAVVKKVLESRGMLSLFDDVFGVDLIERDAGRLYEGVPPVRIQKLRGEPFVVEYAHFGYGPITKELAWLGFDVMKFVRTEMEWLRTGKPSQAGCDALNDLEDKLRGHFVYGRPYEEYKGGADDGFLLEMKKDFLDDYRLACGRDRL